MILFYILGDEKASLATWYCQTFRQLTNIPSKQLCVRLASGGDPTYSFNVRLTGEEVHGTSKCIILSPLSRGIKSINYSHIEEEWSSC